MSWITTTRCKFHPRYTGLQKPKVNCGVCWSVHFETLLDDAYYDEILRHTFMRGD